MIYFHRPREENLLIRSGVFQTLMRCTLRRQPPRIKRMCIRFSLTPYLSGKIAFSRQQRLIYFQYPLHRFYDQSHASVSPLSSGGFNTSPIRLCFFSSSVLAAQSAAPSPILSDNQKSAEHPPQDTGSISPWKIMVSFFCSLCRRDVEISGLPHWLFPASLLIYVKKSISRV